MKRILLILFIYHFTLHAQPNLPPKVADSLWSVWQDERLNDTSRLKALNKYASEGYLHSKPDSAFYYASLQYALAKTKSLKKQMANALRIQGLALYLQGDFSQALDFLNHSLKIYQNIGDKKGEASSLGNIGVLYKKLGQYSEAIKYQMLSLKIGEGIGDKEGVAASLINIGIIHRIKGDYSKALVYYTRSLNIREEIGDKRGIANSFLSIGVIYKKQGDYAKAVDYYTRSLKINEEIGDKNGISKSLNNLGNMYWNLGDYTKAIDYHTQSIQVKEDLGDKTGIATSLSNIGIIYNSKGDYTKALEYQSRSLKICQNISDKHGEATSLANIGSIYHNQKDYNSALEYYTKSLKVGEEIGAMTMIIRALNYIGLVKIDQGYFSKAQILNSRALILAQELGVVREIETAAKSLWKINKKLGNHKKALEMHELYITMRDSIESEENQKEVIRQEYKYEYEKQAAIDSVAFAQEQELANATIAKQQAEAEKKDAQIRVQRNQQFALFGGLGMLGIFGGFMYNRYRLTQKQKGVIELQKDEVEKQKDIIEEAHKDITDSIQYAKRIQTAILPPPKVVKEYLSDSFILYLPKDVVAGDFYWMEQKDGKTLFAAADCTGHGVPGAMVSVICNNGLNRSVREYGITDPGKILDKTREIVIAEFEKSEEEVKDGMDIALCSVQDNILEFSGANNPLWLIRNDELIEIKADKQPIGVFDEPKPYTTHRMELQKGDIFYIFSDGFADQFGGEHNKKFMKSQMRKLFLSVHKESAAKQKELIEKAFTNWKGDREQVDDVCILGVRV